MTSRMRVTIGKFEFDRIMKFFQNDLGLSKKDFRLSERIFYLSNTCMKITITFVYPSK